MSDSSSFDIGDFLPYLLNQAGEVTSREFQSYYKDRYGLLRPEWRVLFHLGRFGEMTAVEISQRAMIHKTKVSRAVAKLVKLGFIVGRDDLNDRRRVHLALTKRGQGVFDDLKAKAEEFDKQCISELSPEEADSLRQILKKFTN